MKTSVILIGLLAAGCLTPAREHFTPPPPIDAAPGAEVSSPDRPEAGPGGGADGPAPDVETGAPGLDSGAPDAAPPGVDMPDAAPPGLDMPDAAPAPGSDAPAPTPPAGCSAGANRCAAGQRVETCTVAGEWILREVCTSVCTGAGVCSGQCKPGSKRCDGRTPSSCDQQGRWIADAVCPFGCRDGVCLTCQPNPETCNGRDDDCDGSIDEDLPPMPCNPRCAGNQTCRNGSWSSSSCARTDTPQSCGSSCRSCPGASGGVPVCNGGSCGISCTGKLCGDRCVPNAELCDGKCDHVRCRSTCVPRGTACEPARALRLWWSVPRLDNYSAASRQGQLNAQGAGYGDAGVMGYIEPRPLPGTRALRCYYEATRGDNLVTTGDAPSHYSGCALGSDGNIEGYVFTSSGPGLVPLVLWYSAERNEYHTVTPHLQRDSDLQAQNYVKRATLGYVYRDPP